MTDPWKSHAMELIARHEVLLQKRLDGEFVERDWHTLVYDLNAHGMWALGNDLKREMQTYGRPAAE